MKKSRLLAAAVLVGATSLSAGALAQHHQTPHPNMPSTKPSPLKFPMSSANFHKLIDWYLELLHLNESKMSDATRAQAQVAVLRVRECTAAVTADGVVTKNEAEGCLGIFDQVQVTLPPR